MAVPRTWRIHALDAWIRRAFVLVVVFCTGAIFNGWIYGVGFLPQLWNNTHILQKVSVHNARPATEAGNQHDCVPNRRLR